MQNKPNFWKSQMNVNKVLTRDYEKKTLGERGKNKPKTNPIPEKPKMKLNSYSTKDYENETAFGLRQYKPNQTQFLYHWLRLLFIIAAMC